LRHTTSQRHQRSSPAACFQGRIPVIEDEFGARQRRPHDLPLHADAAPVNDPQGRQAEPVRFFEIGFDCRFRVARRDGVEIEDV
jgi:hypothetical protein